MPYGFIAKHKMTHSKFNVDLSAVMNLPFLTSSSKHSNHLTSEPSPITALRGIQKSLKQVVEKHEAQYKHYITLYENSRRKKEDGVKIVKKPIAHENLDISAIDPFSHQGYFCKICHQELPNLFLHCIGCEEKLSMDFNICLDCHHGKLYHKLFIMDHFRDNLREGNRKNCCINHTGDTSKLKNYTKDCPDCSLQEPCHCCSYCKGCSCQCHANFNLYYRFMNIP